MYTIAENDVEDNNDIEECETIASSPTLCNSFLFLGSLLEAKEVGDKIFSVNLRSLAKNVKLIKQYLILI